jgi:hypothetical protein
MLLHDALGSPSLLIIAVLIVLVTSTVAAFARLPKRLALIGAALVLASIAAALALPAYDAENPRRLNVMYATDGVRPLWVISRPSAPLQREASFKSDESTFAWIRGGAYQSAPAPEIPVPSVRVEAVRSTRGNRQIVTWRVRSERGAPRVAIFFRTAVTVESIRINGVIPPPLTRGTPRLRPGWHRAAVRNSEASVEVTVGAADAIDYVALDYSYDLPPAGQSLVAARRASIAVPSDDGDMTITLQRGRI